MNQAAPRAVLLDMGASGPRAREGGALVSSLASRGFALERFGDARVLLAHLQDEPADVLVVDADSPTLEVRELVERLRGDARTASLLLAALTSGDVRELPSRGEFALVLAKPINADEAASRIEALVATRLRAQGNARELRGDLAQITLPDLLQLLSVGRARGTLVVDALGRAGTLTLVESELRDITCGPARGLKALVRLLGLSEGTFVFTYGLSEPPPAEGAPPREGMLLLGPALFEATRHVDEIQRLKRVLPGAWVEVRRVENPTVEPALEERSSVRAGREEVLRLLASPRTMGALLDTSPLPDLDLLEAIDGLHRDECIEFVGASVDDRLPVLEAGFAAALVSRLGERGQQLQRIAVVTAEAPSELLRALAGVAGFAPTEGTVHEEVPFGPLGTLALGEARVELFALPLEREWSPLWSVFTARAGAALVLSRDDDTAALVQRLREEMGVGAVAPVAPPARTGGLIEGLRAVLQDLTPRR